MSPLLAHLRHASKGIDGYGPFGPVIVAGVDPAKLMVRTILKGEERQNYPIADMIFTAQELVSRISHDMTLLPHAIRGRRSASAS